MKRNTNVAARGSCPDCGYVQYHNPLPAVSVVVENDAGAVLVGRRRQDPERWGLPSGFIESNENFIQAAHREVGEETGLSITVCSVINVVSNVIHRSLESLVIVVRATAHTGTPTAGDDLTELLWVQPQRAGGTLPPMAFDADAYIIERYFRGSLYEIPVDSRFAGEIP